MNIADTVAAVLVLGGSALALTAAVGVVRFPDTLSRMHAASKPQVLGLLLVLAGAAIRLRGHADVGMVILTGLFTLITAGFVLMTVITTYIIPEISTGFQTLLGISNGVYIGSKIVQRS